MISLRINGTLHKLNVPPDSRLLWVIRDHVGLTGTKYGCGIGECGFCTVLIDGKAERSCGIKVVDAQGKEITTIEGLAPDHPVKKAWIQEQVPQCGYCQPGQIMQAVALLSEDPNPSEGKVIGWMNDVLCRCGTYPRIKKALRAAVLISREEGRKP